MHYAYMYNNQAYEPIYNVAQGGYVYPGDQYLYPPFVNYPFSPTYPAQHVPGGFHPPMVYPYSHPYSHHPPNYNYTVVPQPHVPTAVRTVSAPIPHAALPPPPYYAQQQYDRERQYELDRERDRERQRERDRQTRHDWDVVQHSKESHKAKERQAYDKGYSHGKHAERDRLGDRLDRHIERLEREDRPRRRGVHFERQHTQPAQMYEYKIAHPSGHGQVGILSNQLPQFYPAKA
ncbi:uncharacterized protein EHS24_001137 [Apiotrichum porosum]|uniref:Uncharacterized protein n=1 Tax=Apiotrichum porosum TaxID=105984 RepID=A0A427YBY0_9TREE|nr:uncharacterized protein EHS24_001137 [Apiotrichum porosum]RSH88588.1 hypothetical protein EHS24_001137 [Apiotrichum porosum]